MPEAVSGNKDATETKTKVVVSSKGGILAEGVEESDWTQGNDSPLSNDKKTEWAEYRTLLRDFPSTFTEVPLNDKGYIDESQLTWPPKPE